MTGNLEMKLFQIEDLGKIHQPIKIDQDFKFGKIELKRIHNTNRYKASDGDDRFIVLPDEIMGMIFVKDGLSYIVRENVTANQLLIFEYEMERFYETVYKGKKNNLVELKKLEFNKFFVVEKRYPEQPDLRIFSKYYGCFDITLGEDREFRVFGDTIGLPHGYAVKILHDPLGISKRNLQSIVFHEAFYFYENHALDIVDVTEERSLFSRMKLNIEDLIK